MIRILFYGRGVWQQLGELSESELEEVETLEFEELIDKDDFGPFFGPWDDFASISVYELENEDNFFSQLEDNKENIKCLYNDFIIKENIIYEDINDYFFKKYDFDNQPYFIYIWEKYSGYFGYIDIDINDEIFDINQLFYKSVKWKYGEIDPIIQSVKYKFKNGSSVQSDDLLECIEDAESTGEEDIGWVRRFDKDKKWDEIDM